MSNIVEEELSIPDSLRQITQSFNINNHSFITGEEQELLETPIPTSQLVNLVYALRQDYVQLVMEVASASNKQNKTFSNTTTTTRISLDTSLKVKEKIEAIARHVAEIQKGIRSKSIQCTRLALQAYLSNEIEVRRRALGRMETALNIAKQSI